MKDHADQDELGAQRVDDAGAVEARPEVGQAQHAESTDQQEQTANGEGDQARQIAQCIDQIPVHAISLSVEARPRARYRKNFRTAMVLTKLIRA